MHLIKRTVSLFSLLLGLHRDSKITVNWERHERAICDSETSDDAVKGPLIKKR